MRTNTVLFGASMCIGAGLAYPADSSSIIPTAGSDIKDGDIVFFHSDAPIFRPIFSAPKAAAPAGSTDPNKKAADEANADAQAATADATLKDKIAKSAQDLAAAASKKATGPSATDQDKSWAATTGATATQAAADAKAAHAVSDSKKARAAAVADAMSTPVTAALSDANVDDNAVLCAPMYSRFNVETVVAATTTPAADSAMKIGAVVGWDWQGRSSGFKYEGKTWLALSIGAGF